jgi:hypothetical protein
LNAAMNARTDFREELPALTNAQLLAALDLVLLELEKRLLKYARSGHSLMEMADEGLLLAARASARISQASSAAAHTAGHLQVVGVGEWNPRSTDPAWNDDPRVGEGGGEEHEH